MWRSGVEQREGIHGVETRGDMRVLIKFVISSIQRKLSDFVRRMQAAVGRIRKSIILRHQEQQLNTALEEEINTAARRKSSEVRAYMAAKEASYRDILFTIPAHLIPSMKIMSDMK